MTEGYAAQPQADGQPVAESDEKTGIDVAVEADDEQLAAEFMATLSLSEEGVAELLKSPQRHRDGRPHKSWIEGRRNRLTASRFAGACDVDGSRRCPVDVLREMMEMPEADDHQAGRFGIQMEGVARKAYVKLKRRELVDAARGTVPAPEAEETKGKPEEEETLSDDEMLNGQWQTCGRPLIIHNWKIFWPDEENSESPLTRTGKTSLQMELKGDTFDAEFIAGTLRWDDGDVWTRVLDNGEAEADALVEAEEETPDDVPSFDVLEIGLAVCPEEPWLAASPDGVCWLDGAPVGLLEVKTARCWTERFEQEPPVDWRYQMNGCIKIASRALGVELGWCDLFCWTRHKSSSRRFPFDDELWQQAMYPSLRKFFFETYVPRMVQKERCRLIRAQKVKNKHAEKRAKKKAQLA
eukprot:TRINITY_DN115828_c0_g1_i1.p1 TRINITY_DN115828_c0_g1~~TRINITY_DN115828_c0_g1_i1.p1  ORF type:complete len:410 (+),score=109.05 TRINITY_DN115828_c0_g1_i1:72-1301(+)